MTWTEALDVVSHPIRDRLAVQARDDNPDAEQREAARSTLLRMAGAEPEPPTPTAADVALRAYFERHGCGGCGG